MSKSAETQEKQSLKNLSDEYVKQLANEKGITEAEALFSLMKTNPAIFGALSDWDDVRTISIAVIEEIRPFMSCKQAHDFVIDVVSLYDTQVISVLRVFSDLRRLAYFVNEMIESMLELASYKKSLMNRYGLTENDQIILRGLVFQRITSESVRQLFLSDHSRYFRVENFCAKKFLESKNV